MTIFEKVKNACESKEALAKLIHEQQFACYFCSKSEWCDGHCEEGIGAWIKNRDNSPFTVLDLNSGKTVGTKECREIVKSCGLCTSYDDMLVVGEDGNAYIVPGRTAIKLSEENFKVTWRENGK